MFIRTEKLAILGALLVAAVIGCRSPQRQAWSWATERASSTTYAPPAEQTSSHGTPDDEEWVCPMHPSFKLPYPGKCSICGMDLVPSGEAASGGRSSSDSGHSHSSHSGHSKKSGGCGHCG